MKSLRPLNWKWQWSLVLLLLTLGGFGMLEPDTAEAAKSTVTVSAMLGVGWFIWHLMNYE
jgi:hypothetical protein